MMMACFLGLLTTRSTGTEDRYLVSCTLNVSAGNSISLYLNGHLVDRVSYTNVRTGPQKIIGRPSSLCYFQAENIFAFELDGSNHITTLSYGYTGFAYSVDLEFSDGSHRIITSNETNQHLSLYLADRLVGNPRGWENLDFDETGWQVPYSAASIPGLPEVWNPQTGIPVGYLSASKTVPLQGLSGERHLFRRKFSLEMAPAPQCREPKPVANLYISCEEGPGVYQVEILDNDGRHVKTAFQKKVFGKISTWVPWDGKDEKGTAVPSGTYQAVYTKDGSPLRATTFSTDMGNQ